MDAYHLLAYHTTPDSIQSHSDNPRHLPDTFDTLYVWVRMSVSERGLWNLTDVKKKSSLKFGEKVRENTEN